MRQRTQQSGVGPRVDNPLTTCARDACEGIDERRADAHAPARRELRLLERRERRYPFCLWSSSSRFCSSLFFFLSSALLALALDFSSGCSALGALWISDGGGLTAATGGRRSACFATGAPSGLATCDGCCAVAAGGGACGGTATTGCADRCAGGGVDGTGAAACGAAGGEPTICSRCSGLPRCSGFPRGSGGCTTTAGCAIRSGAVRCVVGAAGAPAVAGAGAPFLSSDLPRPSGDLPAVAAAAEGNVVGGAACG